MVAEQTVDDDDRDVGLLYRALRSAFVGFWMAVLIPARTLYPKEIPADKGMPGLRFVVITIAAVYLWLIAAGAIAIYCFATSADPSVVSSLAAGLWKAARPVLLLWAGVMLAFRKRLDLRVKARGVVCRRTSLPRNRI